MLKQQQEKINFELKDVQPTVDAAKKAVGSISKSDLNELRTLKMPPEAIIDVLQVVLKMMGQDRANWPEIRQFLSGRGVLESLMEFDARSISSSQRDELGKLIAKRSNSFEKNTIYRASLAAGPIADWLKAMIMYSEVLEKIKPLETQKNKLQKRLNDAMNRLDECRVQLNELDGKVVELKNNF